MTSARRVPVVEGLTLRELDAVVDRALVQDLFERATDFHELTEGVPTRPAAAEEELTSVAPGRTEEDQFRLGIFEEDHLAGIIIVSRHFPKESQWWIALLELEPAARGRGIGQRVHDSLCNWIAEQDGTAIWLGVLEQNSGARRFWSRMGYVEQERQQWTAPTGLVSPVILMKRPV